MLIYNATGVTSTSQFRITKSIGSLLFRTDVLLSALANETITIEIERRNGGNTPIATQLPIKDFVLGSVYGGSAVFSDGSTLVTCAVCELAPNGLGLYLQENEAILIKMEGLTSAKTYSLHGMEEPVTASSVIGWERKVALIGETSKRFEVPDYESVVINGYANITELALTYSNGVTCKLTKEELIASSVDTDPVLSISSAGVVASELTDRICYPLIGVTAIEVVKASANQIDFMFRNEKNNY